MKSNVTLCAISSAFLFSIQANAQEAVQPPSLAAPAAAEKPSSPPQSASKSKLLPMLSVSWDCGSCEPNPKVVPLIEQSYAAEAAAKGFAVSSTESAEVVIKEFRQRNPAARAIFGVFSGKDKLGTRLTFRGKEYTAEDYSANAVQGMNSLCESVARQALAHLMVAIKE